VSPDLEALTRNYRVAFLRYLPQRAEAALTLGYEIGRDAVAQDVSLLHLAQVHHEVLSEVLADTPPEKLRDIATAASEFFLEVLSTFEMARLTRADAPDAPNAGA
jgi:hypothetical protein